MLIEITADINLTCSRKMSINNNIKSKTIYKLLKISLCELLAAVNVSREPCLSFGIVANHKTALSVSVPLTWESLNTSARAAIL